MPPFCTRFRVAKSCGLSLLKLAVVACLSISGKAWQRVRVGMAARVRMAESHCRIAGARVWLGPPMMGMGISLWRWMAKAGSR